MLAALVLTAAVVTGTDGACMRQCDCPYGLNQDKACTVLAGCDCTQAKADAFKRDHNLAYPETKPAPKLFSALTAQYVGGVQFGAGLAGKTKSGLIIMGQVLAGTTEPSNFTSHVCPYASRHRCFDVPINPPGEDNWGVGVTVLIPLK